MIPGLASIFFGALVGFSIGVAVVFALIAACERRAS